MSSIRYDNERDRNLHGFDAGNIVDGTVTYDESSDRYVLVDEDGVGFDPQVVLEKLAGKQVRLTMVSLETLVKLEDMYQAAQDGGTPVLVEPSGDSD